MSKFTGVTPTILVMNDLYYLPYVLESLRSRFDRYVIYDAGSEDGTLDIIDWFVETEDAEFFVRKLPFAHPSIQGCYRNSMLVEAQTEWSFIVDGDEIYNPSSLDNLREEIKNNLIYADNTWPGPERYGVVRRTEVAEDLLHRYSEDRTHHRLYHRSAYFKGNHPGEAPVFKQKKDNEYHMKDVMCWHLHNVLRSPLESSVPKRLDRKSQGTYHPGELVLFDLLKELPILRRPIEGFTVSPVLERLQYDATKV